MWIVVNTWVGDSLQGQLANEPHLRLDLRAGQRIELHDADIFDWMLRLPEGEAEGGYTTRVLINETDSDEG